jgi:DNA polymerase I-like protein with 3'-5' exonuclease and polymerase domains
MSFLTVDTETSGRDFYHSTRPFHVTTCDHTGRTRQYEWSVDPLTREVRPDEREVGVVQELIDSYDTLVCHNAKFDVTALRTVGVIVPWDRVEDTLVAAHVLDSSAGHRLDELALRYLGENITTHEAKLEAAVKTGRRRVQSARLKDKRKTGTDADAALAKWRIAVDGMTDLPSAKGGGADGEGKLWRNDYWLPAALRKAFPDNPEFTGFDTVLAEYAEIDSSVTALLWPVLRDKLIERGLWKVYRAKFAAVPAAFRMETHGVTINKTVMDAAQKEYTEEAEYLGELCVGLAKRMGYDLVLPKSTSNHSLDDFVFGRAQKGEDGKRDPKSPRVHRPDTLNLLPVKRTESGNPSFDYDARELYLADLTPGTRPYLFVESFGRRCELDTGLSYLAGYQRFVLPLEKTDDVQRGDFVDSGGVSRDLNTNLDVRRDAPGTQDGVRPRGNVVSTDDRGGATASEFVVLHPNLNCTGAATTRWSHSNPNSANVSERSVVNARACFCPAPGREWYSMDAANIELRIPAYLAGESELIDIFERPNDPPYYGSYHLLVFDTIHPELFAKYGKNVKTECASEYSCTKNGNFARQYGCQEAKADATYRVKGAYRKIGQRFPKIDALNRRIVSHARETGGVTTVPDRSVDPNQGYPITCRRSQWGTISPTVPFAYFVSGTAGFWLNQAVVRCDAQLEAWRADEGYDGHMILSVHDELVFSLPSGVDNSGRIAVLRRLMEQGGDDISVPTPVTIERHVESWAVGESIK